MPHSTTKATGTPSSGSNAVAAEAPGDIAADHDEIALRQVLDVHHAPHQREAIGGEREDRADQHAVDQQAEIEDRRRRSESRYCRVSVPSRTLSAASCEWRTAVPSRRDRATRPDSVEAGGHPPASGQSLNSARRADSSAVAAATLAGETTLYLPPWIWRMTISLPGLLPSSANLTWP